MSFWPRKTSDGKWACGGIGDTQHRLVWFDDTPAFAGEPLTEQAERERNQCFLCEAIRELRIVQAQVEQLQVATGKPAPEAPRIIAAINELRAEEGDGVTILCDNLSGRPDRRARWSAARRNVEVFGEWTGWEAKRFGGATLIDALRAAVEAKRTSQGGSGRC